MKVFYIAAISSILLFAPALAADFNAPIKAIDGKDIHMCPVRNPSDTDAQFAKDCNAAPVMTLKDVSTHALAETYPDEVADPRDNKPGVSGDEKFKRVVLGLNIQGAKDGQLELSSEQTTMLKGLISKSFPPVIMTRAWLLLDPSMKKAK